ncbi:MAG: glutamate 5-kinase [Clostridiales bacterium]|jgi:glutamate 5-kinase|nr:glutamate 5-kinase [Clostridiales bacterium]
MENKNIQKRIVVKVGTSTLTHEGGTLNFRSFDALARVLSDIQNCGAEVVLVSSGAIAVGAHKLMMKERPKEMRFKQAAAAVGQCELMHLYDKFFGDYGKTVAQILLTGDDIELPEKKQNLINTFNALLEMGIIPIVNENDSVSYTEIESEHKIFGDNDTLSAVVAVLCNADMLVLLTDIDGLFDANPHENPDARLIREVRVIDEEIRSLAGGSDSSVGTGGMITKLQAAELATKNGIDMIIANGATPELLYDIVEERPTGTIFVARKGR